VWLEYVRANGATRTWNDAYGNCFAELAPTVAPAGGAKPFTVAVCGHADEIGLMVNHIDSNGFVYCRSIGGIDAGSIVGKRLQFRSSVPGVDAPVLGLIGAGGIGQILFDSMNSFNYPLTAAISIVIVTAVTLIDLLSQTIRTRLL
jgi:hypothetical protein